jgi:hypothetical protein
MQWSNLLGWPRDVGDDSDIIADRIVHRAATSPGQINGTGEIEHIDSKTNKGR